MNDPGEARLPECAYCGGKEGIHTYVIKQNGEAASCSGGDVAVLRARLVALSVEREKLRALLEEWRLEANGDYHPRTCEALCQCADEMDELLAREAKGKE